VFGRRGNRGFTAGDCLTVLHLSWGDVLARAVKDRRTVTWTFDIDSYRFLDASDATVELFGYSREELLTKDIYDVVAP
jgi:PAS domain-containing protein